MILLDNTSYGDLQEASFTERLTHREGPRSDGQRQDDGYTWLWS